MVGWDVVYSGGIMFGMSKFKFMFGGATSVVPLGLNSLYL